MKLNFEKNKSEYIPLLKKLWLDCFEEKSEAVDLFFNHCLGFTSIYTASIEDKPVAMLYLVHSTLNGKKAHYLCCAATSLDYRNLGIMGRLIEYALKDSSKNDDVYSLLFPANERLYEYYERFGYKPLCTARKAVFTREELIRFAENNQSKRTSVNSYNYEELQRLCLKDNFLLQNNNFISFASDYYSLYDCKTVKSENCFALFEEENGTAKVFYSIYDSFYTLAEILINNSNAKRFVFTGKADDESYKNSKNEKYGMIKSLGNNEIIPENTYIGITLS
ncbi:GNAT family N-acetyltransferase [Ruminococcus sp.]|uniref:GNAT family N-acetyltransferase n=1 Tax=Ruminococcus sp. TaxID=41978 RepID=UPI0025FDE14E|nr:GNAT family N-acetyltransferase [Ruminococcus sp.]MCI6617086.1 GNAT family N-acetyltransferase [Ruminococcus sp.]